MNRNIAILVVDDTGFVLRTILGYMANSTGRKSMRG